MKERVDVCIVGSGFGGSIAAWRLAELYDAAEQRPSVVVLERGLSKDHTDFRQSMDVDNLSDVYALIQGQARRSWSPTSSEAARTSTWPPRCGRRARPSSAATADPTTGRSGGCGQRRSAAPTSTSTTRGPSAGSASPPRAGTAFRSPGASGRPCSARPGTAATACHWRSAPSAASTRSGATRAASSAPRTR